MRRVDEKKHWSFRIVFPIELKSEQLKETSEDVGIKSKFLIDSNQGTQLARVDKSKWASEGKMYLNVFAHEE